jgi:pimeloyl-ACP methyl ester carboxylesterase
MTGRDRWLELPHRRVAAREWGRGAGPPVLALHGWLDNAASFERLAPLLPELHLVAIDLPGHGRSDHRPPGCPHHFVNWVPVVMQAAGALGWDEFSLVGHSMGAGIAALMPAVEPERINRLVLLEGVGPTSTPAADAPRQLAAALASEAALEGTPNRLFPDLEAAITARRRGSDLDVEGTRLLVERGSRAEAGGVRFTHDPRLKTRSRLRLTEEQVLAFLAAIRCPVLAVRASRGWPYPPEMVAGRLASIPQAQVVEVEGGHHVHLTHPERVAPHIRSFFEL